MNVGKTVYLNWYDFNHKAEYVCMGMVVDNSLWADTQWKDYINVSFQPPHAAGPFCHHFPEDKLSLTPDNVPHDDCYLVCGNRRTIDEAKPQMYSASERLIRFKQEHWDAEHNHLQTEYLDEFCELWREVCTLRMGMKATKPVTNTVQMEYPTTPAEAATSPKRIVSDEKMEQLKGELKELFKEPTSKEKRSTGRIQYKDTIQTSIFDL